MTTLPWMMDVAMSVSHREESGSGHESKWKRDFSIMHDSYWRGPTVSCTKAFREETIAYHVSQSSRQSGNKMSCMICCVLVHGTFMYHAWYATCPTHKRKLTCIIFFIFLHLIRPIPKNERRKLTGKADTTGKEAECLGH